MRKIVVLMLWFIVFSPDFIWAQYTVNDNITIDFNSSDKFSNTRKILSVLALGNNKDLKQIKLYYKCEFFLEASSLTNGKIKLHLLPEIKKINGDYEYRGFDIRSKIKPSGYLLNLIVRKDGYEIFNENIILNSNGKDIVLETSKRVFSLTNTEFIIKIISTSFTKSDIDNLDETVEKVNYYYGFNELLSELNQRHQTSSSQTSMEASEVFLLWQETVRVDAYISEIAFISSLDVVQNDPVGFNSKYSEFKRYKKRWQTLAGQKLERDLKKGFLADKQNYINSLLKLSENYYEESLKEQPYIASTFLKLTEIKSVEEDVINKIFYYYDGLSYGKNVSIPRQLYDGFVNLGNKYYDQSKNNMALSMLKNARKLQEYFDLQKSDLYTESMAATLNGMIESFLKVSTKAVKRGNLRFAENYFREAEKVYDNNSKLFDESGIAVTPFLIYIDAQKQKAFDFADNKEFDKCDEVIVNCFNIAEEKNLKRDSTLLILQKSVRSNIYLRKLKLISDKIENNNISQAQLLLAEADEYRKTNEEIITDSANFSELAYSIFLEYLQKGEVLLDKSYIDMAYVNLLKAREIQTEYLNYNVENLDNLLKKYSEPKILEICERARLDTWAKRNENARILLDSAINLRNKYGQEENPIINKAISELRNKMQSRHCLEANFNISESNKLFVTNIHEGEFDKAYENIRNSYEISDDNSDCSLDMHQTDSLINKYSYVLDFKQAYDNMKSKLFEKGYSEAIDEYLKLRQYYYEYNISTLNFKLPTLEEFVKQQNLVNLTVSSIEYFTEKKQFQLAFEYMKILQSESADSKQFKEVQIALAEAWRNSENFNKDEVEEMLNEVKEGLEWYKYFRREINKKYILFLKN